MSSQEYEYTHGVAVTNGKGDQPSHGVIVRRNSRGDLQIVDKTQCRPNQWNISQEEITRVSKSNKQWVKIFLYSSDDKLENGPRKEFVVKKDQFLVAVKSV